METWGRWHCWSVRQEEEIARVGLASILLKELGNWTLKLSGQLLALLSIQGGSPGGQTPITTAELYVTP